MPRPPHVLRRILLSTCVLGPLAVVMAAGSSERIAIEHGADKRAALAGPGRLAIARLQYDGGGDWYANPSSLPNLIRAIAERTSLPIERTEAKVRLTDSALFDFPFLHVTGHGEIKLSEREVQRLREYLTRGGFLHAWTDHARKPRGLAHQDLGLGRAQQPGHALRQRGLVVATALARPVQKQDQRQRLAEVGGAMPLV